jgi:hypothetical protein
VLPPTPDKVRENLGSTPPPLKPPVDIEQNLEGG